MKRRGTPFEQFYAEPSRNGVYKPADFRGRGVQMVNMGELFGYEFIGDQEMERIELSDAELERSALIDGDLLFGRRSVVEAGAGKCALVVEPNEPLTFESSIIRVRLDREKANPRFFHYFFSSPQGRGLVGTIVSGAAVKGIRGSDLAKLGIVVPSLKVQNRVAEFLRTYDELLENNRRRMALLEDAARQLYQEWFVRLRFPGHEHTRIVDSIPEGWQRVPTPDAIDVNPSTLLSDESEHWYVEMSDLPTDSMVIQKAVKREGRSGSKFRNGDTLLARITPCLENGKTGFVNFMADGEVGRGSTEFIVLRPKRVTSEYVYCLARTYHFRENAIKSMVGASGRQRVQESSFDKFLVWLPPSSILTLFSEFAEPVFRQIRLLHAQTQRLVTARDLLLPKLIGGEVAV